MLTCYTAQSMHAALPPLCTERVCALGAARTVLSTVEVDYCVSRQLCQFAFVLCVSLGCYTSKNKAYACSKLEHHDSSFALQCTELLLTTSRLHPSSQQVSLQQNRVAQPASS